MKIRAKHLATGALVLVGMSMSSCFLLPREQEILAPPLAEPPEITYRTLAVSRGDLQDSIRAFGTFVSANQSDLYFDRRGGRLRTIYVSIGDDIQAGQLIADLYTDSLEAEITQAELSLRRSQIALERVREQADDEFALEFATADRDLARLRLEELQAELERERELAEIAGSTSSAVRSLERSVQEQQIALRKADLRIRQIEQSESSRDLELAQIDVEANQIRLDRLREELDATKLYAPISGVVTWISRQAEEGENVQAFQRILRIANPQDLLFEYQGRDSSEFDVGMRCELSVRDDTLPGTVILTPTSVPFDQREEYEDTVQIRVDAPLTEGIRLGSTGTAELILAERENVLVLPKRAVQRYATRRYVHVLVNGVRVERDIEIGLETATEVEIVRGLEEGEEVVLR
jgi:macrolide-specific efflux system membrane fusion protein